MARPAKIAMKSESHGPPAHRVTVRGLLVMQSWIALIIVVFIGHWGWGVFLLAMYLAGIGILLARRSSGGRRMFVGVAALAAILLLYPLSLGPCRDVLRIFEMRTRAKLVNSIGWIYAPLSHVYQPASGLECLCNRDNIDSGLCGAYHFYIESFE